MSTVLVAVVLAVWMAAAITTVVLLAVGPRSDQPIGLAGFPPRIHAVLVQWTMWADASASRRP